MKKAIYNRNISHAYKAVLDKTLMHKTLYINIYINLFYVIN